MQLQQLTIEHTACLPLSLYDRTVTQVSVYPSIYLIECSYRTKQ